MFKHSRPLHLIRGDNTEHIACQYLEEKGLQVIDKNFRCKYGELDIIMRDGETLVIVEVRFRKSNKYGGALESITYKKRSRIITTTQYYLLNNKNNCPIRFDVITMSNDTDIKWIKNAFQPN